MKTRFPLPLAAWFLCLAASASAQSPPPPHHPSLVLVNRSGLTVTEIHVSPSPVPVWGPDVLGSAVLDDGASFEARLPSVTCVWDVKVIFRGGLGYERRDLDTCRSNDLVLMAVPQSDKEIGEHPAPTPHQGTPQASHKRTENPFKI